MLRQREIRKASVLWRFYHEYCDRKMRKAHVLGDSTMNIATEMQGGLSVLGRFSSLDS